MLQAGIKDKSYGCHITKWLDKYALRNTKCKGDMLNYAVKVTEKGTSVSPGFLMYPRL